MNPSAQHTQTRSTLGRLAALGTRLLVGATLIGLPGALLGQIIDDNFNDANDTGWTHFDSIGTLFGPRVTYSFPNGAYRVQSLASPAPGVPPAGVGPARGGCWREDHVYSQFYVSVDLVDWNPNINQAFGLLARVNGTNALQGLNGYAFTWEPGSNITPTSGDTDITVITGEVPVDQIETESSGFHLDIANDYRMVFTGKGNKFEARIYQLPNTETPVFRLPATDNLSSPDQPTYASGWCGLVIYDNSSAGTLAPDATFDNFFVSTVEPPKLSITWDPGFVEVTVSWLTNTAPFRLESATVLNHTNTAWTSIDPAFVFPSGDRWVYTEGPVPGLRAFRLIQD